MIILDTNVLSEPMKTNGDPAVATWLDRQNVESLYLTTINLAELWLGLELLPLSRRRSALEARMAEVIGIFNDRRILPFDTNAARFYAPPAARARMRGHAIAVADGQIASIAAAKGFAVATRDASPFIAMGVSVVDPWS